MNTFIFNDLNELEILSCFGKRLETDDEAHIAITGLIEVNAENERVLVKLLEDLAPMVPKDKWFDYFFRCHKYIHSSKKFCMIIKKAHAIIREITSAKLAVKVFTQVEQLYVSREMSFCNRNLLKIAASKAYELTRDKRYMLFRDYADVYTSADKEELTTSVNSLLDLLDSKILGADKRCAFYLFALAIKKLAICRGYTKIYESTLQNLYDACREEKFHRMSDYEDEDGYYYVEQYIYGKLNIFSKILKYNCPEIVNIFNPIGCYYDADFMMHLNESARMAIEDNKYSSERSPIVSQEFVFLS